MSPKSLSEPDLIIFCLIVVDFSFTSFNKSLLGDELELIFILFIKSFAASGPLFLIVFKALIKGFFICSELLYKALAPIIPAPKTPVIAIPSANKASLFSNSVFS